MVNEQILLIDTTTQETLIRDTLALERYSVTTVSATSVWDLLSENSYDLCLLDFEALGADPLDGLTKLREHSPTLPVVLFVDENKEYPLGQLLRYNIKSYLPKLVEPTELRLAVEQALAEPRLRQERDALAERMQDTSDQLNQRMRELSTLFGVGKSVTSLLDQSRLLNRLVEAAVYLTNADEGVLLMLDEQAQQLCPVATQGVDDRSLPLLNFNLEGSIPGEVVSSGQPLVLNKSEVPSLEHPYPINAVTFVPLRLKSEVKGVLFVSNRHQAREFTNYDLRLLSTLADYAVISLENSALVRQLDQERRKFDRALEPISEPIALLDAQRRTILYSNDAFRQTFASNNINVVGQSIEDIVPLNNLGALLRDASIKETQQWELSMADGRILRVGLSPHFDGRQALALRDITHLKGLEAVKSEFVANVAHDLRTPLISLKGYADMLGLVGPLSEKQSRFAERIGGGVEKMLELIDNLLDLSKIEAGVELDQEQFDLNEVATEVMAELQQIAKQKSQKLTYLAPSQSIAIVGDPVRIKQVMANLVGNAIKYTPEKGQITVLLQESEAQLLFTVEDDGLGIPPTDMPYVFDKFYRVESDDRGDIQGTGLGLAISKSVVEWHGGSIWVESEHNRGSTFAFTLPRQTAADDHNRGQSVASPLSAPSA